MVVRLMRISVIIPLLNAERTIAACIEGFLQQKVPPHEVILVDNNSCDRSPTIIQRYVERSQGNFIYVVEPKKGPSFARNCGAKLAEGDILAFIDADCIPHPDWIDNISNAFDRSQVGAVAGRIIPASLESSLEKFHALFTMKGLPEDQIFREFTLVEGGFPTANLAVRKTLFEKIAGFDENLEIYSEDYDLCARIYNAGFRIKYSNEICVYHKHRNSLTGTLRQSFGFGTGHACNLKKHFEKMVIIEVPGRRILTRHWKARLWLNFSSADKKMIALAVLFFFWSPAAMLIALYIGYMLRQIGKKQVQRGFGSALPEKFVLLVLLFAKSFALSCGRIYGSLKYSVFCF